MPDQKPDLTTRQAEVLKGIAQGKKNRDMAQELKIGAKTVEKHRGALYRAFGVDNAVSLVVAAHRAGVIVL